MSHFPPLKAPDGFELGVFARMMLSQLPNAESPAAFESDLMQKVSGEKVQRTARPVFNRSFNWKTGLASLALLATLASVTWFTGVLDSYGIGNGQGTNPQPTAEIVQLPAAVTPPGLPVTTDIQRADKATKREVVRRGQRAVGNFSKGVPRVKKDRIIAGE